MHNQTKPHIPRVSRETHNQTRFSWCWLSSPRVWLRSHRWFAVVLVHWLWSNFFFFKRHQSRQCISVPAWPDCASNRQGASWRSAIGHVRQPSMHLQVAELSKSQPLTNFNLDLRHLRVRLVDYSEGEKGSSTAGGLIIEPLFSNFISKIASKHHDDKQCGAPPHGSRARGYTGLHMVNFQWHLVCGMSRKFVSLVVIPDNNNFVPNYNQTHFYLPILHLFT